MPSEDQATQHYVVFLNKLSTVGLSLDDYPERTIAVAQVSDPLEPANIEHLDYSLFLLGHGVENPVDGIHGNEEYLYDGQPDAGTTTLPSRAGWHTYLYVFEGAADVGDESVGYTESALVTGGDVSVTATEDATIAVFSINPDAPVTRQGTIGR